MACCLDDISQPRLELTTCVKLATSFDVCDDVLQTVTSFFSFHNIVKDAACVCGVGCDSATRSVWKHM